jgi:hypothetical protein
LLMKFCLMFTNPWCFGDNKKTNTVIVHSQWRSDSYSSIGWIDSQMEIFDIFFDKFYGEIVDTKLRHTIYHTK